MSTRIRRTVLTGAAVVAVGIGAAASPSQAGGGDSLVTSGDFGAFATATGAEKYIAGHATMERKGIGESKGKTKVSIKVSGLEPGATYGSHVHAAACNAGYAGGHYKHDPEGDPFPPNEIWPGPITANDEGEAKGKAKADFAAGPTAVSVVIHRSDGGKIACADLR